MNRFHTLIMLGLVIVSCSTPSSTGDNSAEETEGGEFIEYNNPPADGFNQEGSDLLATLLADKAMLAMGGREAWDGTRFISWNFLGRRSHLWDKHTGDVRIESSTGDLTILMNINSKKGKVLKEGSEMTDSLDYFLQKGYEWWVNDSYWLVMPFKLKDTGVTLKYVREDSTLTGKLSDVISLSFEGVGVTPENMYEVWVDVDSKLITQWAYYPDASASEPRFVTPWADYKKYGEILLSGNRGDLMLSNIKVPKTIPDNALSSFGVKYF